MGSAIHADQVDLDQAMAKRNKTFTVHHAKKADARKEIEVPAISERKCPLCGVARDADADVEFRCQLMVEAERQHQGLNNLAKNRANSRLRTASLKPPLLIPVKD